MKRKQARLAELRAMPYEEYLLTPEWQETRTAAFAWAGNQCQQCLATHVPLGAYHTSDEHRGAEQEGEVIVLCEPCYARLSAEPYPDFSLSTKAALFGPAAVVTVGVPLLLHAPLPAELFGLGAAIALAVKSPTLYGQMKEALPAPVVDLLDGLVARRHARHHARQWSRWDRLLGRHLHEQVQDEQETEHEEGEQDVSQGDAPAAEKPKPQGQDGPWVPPQFLVDEVLDIAVAFNTRGCVYFGTSEQGAIALSLKGMSHVLDVSSSGKGKSNRLRLAMLQIVNQAETYCINPFAANVKAVTDERQIEVWKPIYDRLADKRPIKEGGEIKDLMTSLVGEIARRHQREDDGDFSWQARPLFVFIDELPEVFARCPEAVKLLDRIGRTGRQFSVFAWVASQTANVHEIGLSTAAQAQFMTRIYGGGDKPSADRLMKGSLPKEAERLLQASGAGLTVMLAEGLETSTLVRAPLVSNEMLFAYLGLPPFRTEEWIRANKAHPSVHNDEATRRHLTEKEQTTRHSATGLSPSARDAYNAYMPGMTYRDIRTALGCEESEARELWLELKRRRLLRSPVHNAELDEAQSARANQAPSPMPSKEQAENIVPIPVLPENGPRAEDIDLAVAIDLWNKGYNSDRKLAKVFRMTKYQGNRLAEMIKEHAKNQQPGNGTEVD